MTSFNLTYDARGHRVYTHLHLLAILKDEKSRQLLRGNFLGSLIVSPYIQIRVFREDPSWIEVIRYGVGPVDEKAVVIEKRGIEALRRFWSRAEAAGWKREKTKRFVTFTKDAIVRKCAACSERVSAF